MISAYLLMDEAHLSDAQASAARAAGADWQIVSARNGRQIVSAIAPEAMVQPMLALLAPFHPVLVGVWPLDPGCDGEGKPLPCLPTTFDPATVPAFLDAMPDDPPGVRPTAPADVVRWAGWQERVFP